jgi:hypothetical protein
MLNLRSSFGGLSFLASGLASQQRDDASGAAGCLACGGFMITLIVATFVLNIALLIWVARDAKNRGMDGAVLWMLLVFFLGPLGLIIYVFSRPGGATISCSQCGNKRLEASAKCPHCGNA